MRYCIQWWGNEQIEDISAETYQWYLNRGVHQFDVLEEIDEADNIQVLDEFLSGLAMTEGRPTPEQLEEFDRIMNAAKARMGGVQS